MEYYFQTHRSFTEKTVIQTGLQLVEKLQAIHERGYLYNDLKPDNIVVGDFDGQKLGEIRLIDFGISKKYLDEHGNHIQKSNESIFRGNMIFSSINAFNFETLSRRDDLISLCYLLVFILDGDLPFIFRP